MSHSSYEEEFSCLYRAKLNELIIPQKPLINALTMLAEENQIYSGLIITLISNKINSENNVERRLPLIYLFDSIIKNISSTGEFKAHISAQLPALYNSTYKLAANNDKQKLTLHKLLQLWKDGKWLNGEAIDNMSAIVNSAESKKRNVAENTNSTEYVKRIKADHLPLTTSSNSITTVVKPAINPEIERVLVQLQSALVNLPHLLPRLNDLRSSVEGGLDAAGIQAKIEALMNAIKVATQPSLPQHNIPPPYQTQQLVYSYILLC
jgi:hypothetical protein